MENNTQIKAYNYLYKAILTNELSSGEPISESKIAQELGTSRTPVREALKRLETEGLVKQFPGRGTFVAVISVQDIEEIFMLRETFELLALKTAYKRISNETLENMERYFLSLTDKSNPEEYYTGDQMLHGTIINHGGNGRLINFTNMINAQIQVVRRISALDPEHFSHAKEEHLGIIRAMKHRDLEMAQDILVKHIREVKKRTIDILTFASINVVNIE